MGADSTNPEAVRRLRVPKIRFCNIDDEGRRGPALM
jgi:hypothetical protein